MVSVVIGSGAGLTNTSRELLGAAGEFGQASMGRAGERVSVNAATGNLVIQRQDEFLGGIGPDVGLLRTYNSQGATWDGDNGDGWRMAYYRKVHGLSGGVNAAGSSIKRIDADGLESTYVFNTTAGKYLSTDGDGQYDALTYNSGTDAWTWTDGDSGLAESYQVAGTGNYRLSEITDSEGHAVKVGYDAATGLISTLSTWKKGAAAAAETVTLSYGANSRLDSVRTAYLDTSGSAKTRTLTRYTYDATTGKLNKVITDLTPDNTGDNATYGVSYTYHPDGKLWTIEQTDGSRLTFTYTADHRVQTITDAQNGVTRFDYDTLTRTTTVTDALLKQTQLVYDEANRLKEVSGAATGGAAFKQSYTYSSNGELLTSTNGKSETTAYEYTGTGALRKRTDAAGNVLERSYDAATGLLLSETTYTVPDADGPGGAAAASGAQTTRYLYDTSSGRRRLIYAQAADGLITKFLYDTAGWSFRTLHRYPAAYTGSTWNLSALNTWAAQQESSATALMQVTEEHYNSRGDVSVVRQYGTMAWSNPSAKLVGGNPFRSFSTFDAFGRLLSTSNDKNEFTYYTYDGLNRLSTVKDPSNAVTTYTYDDAGRKTSVKLHNGQVTVQLFDTLGNLVSSEEMGTANAGLGKTEYSYDALGRLRRIKDPTGVSAWTLYDPTGRKSADIAANGQLTEYLYDGAGREIQRIAYAKLLSGAQMASLTGTDGKPAEIALGSLRPVADDSLDRVTTRYYDAAGRLVGLRDADGYLTESRYDGVSQLVASIRYATAGAVSRLVVGANATIASPPNLVLPTLDAGKDRSTRFFYSAVGRLVGQLDAEGYFTHWSYDQSGNKLRQVRLAKPASEVLRAEGTLANFLAMPKDPDDEVQQCVYDNAGRLVAELDAEGQLTEYSYDAANRLYQTKRYKGLALDPVTGSAGSVAYVGLTRSLVAALVTALGTPETTTRTYNSRGLLETETAPNGTVIRYEYDSVGRLQYRYAAHGSTEQRKTEVAYDQYGRVDKEVDARLGELRHSYDGAGRRIKTEDRRGNPTFFYYDEAGRLVFSIRKTDQGGEVSETIYSNFSEVRVGVQYSARLGVADTAALTGGLANASIRSKVAALSDASKDSRTEVIFNRRGLIQQAIDALGAKTESSYDAFGQLTSSVSDVDRGAAPRRLSSSWEYDRRGQLRSSSRTGSGLTLSSASEYDAFGRLTATVDERGTRTQYSYLRNDGSGRKLVVTDPSGSATTVYDAMGRVLERTDRSNRRVTVAYDTASRTMTLRTDEGISTVTTYNRHGETVRVAVDGQQGLDYSYDANGNLLTITDALGNVTRNSYDQNDNLIRLETGLKSVTGQSPTNDGSARTTSYVYDAANRQLKQIVDPDGLNLQTQFSYDGQGRRLTITDARGVVTTHRYNAMGELTEVVQDSGGLALTTTYKYDAKGRTLEVIQGAGTAAARKTSLEYDALGRRVAEVVDPDALNHRTAFEYDAAGNLVLKRDALGKISRYRYDTANRLLHSVDATGAVTRHFYDEEGRVTGTLSHAVRLADGWQYKTDAQLAALVGALGSQGDQLSTQAYDKDGRLTYSVDATGAVTRYWRDSSGREIQRVEYANPISVGAQPKSLTEIQGETLASATNDRVTRFSYDAAGRLEYTVDALGGVEQLGYDRTGLVISRKQFAQTIDVSGPATPLLSGEVAQRLLPNAAKDRLEYFTYDGAGRERFRVDAEGYVSETRYSDASGVTTSLRYASALGAQYLSAAPSTATFTPAVLTSLGSAISSSSTLDRAGRVQSRTDGNNVTTRFEYDAVGRIVLQTEAFGIAGKQTSTRWEYDAAGWVLAKTVAYGTEVAATTRYEVDALGRVKTSYSPRGEDLATSNADWAIAERLQKGYPADANALSEGQRLTLIYSERTSYTYDAVGRQLTMTDATGAVRSNVYDAFGNIVKVVDPRGNAGYFYFDALNRVKLAVDPEGRAVRYEYDGSSRNVSVERRHALRVTNPSTSVVPDPSNDAQFDAVTRKYYDKLGRLTRQVDAELYEDAVEYGLDGNRFDQVQVNKANGRTELRFDRNGRLVSEKLPVLSAGLAVVNRYEYDAWGNRVRSVEAEGLAEQRITNFKFDNLGRVTHRIGSSVPVFDIASGTEGNATPVEFTRYDALGNVVETISGGHWTGNAVVGGSRSLDYFDAAGHQTARVAANGALTVFVRDRVGNAIQETAFATVVDISVQSIAGAPSGTALPGKDRVTLMRYDAVGRLVERARIGVRYWEPGANDANFTTALQDPGVLVLERLAYDESGNLVEEIDARGNAILHYYDRVGRKSLTIDQEGYATTWDYADIHDEATVQRRYAERMAAGSYVRQTDYSQNASLRDPARIVMGMSSAADRITIFVHDRMGQLEEKRVLNVQTSYVDANGATSSGNQVAITKYQYNGLGKVTKTSELVGTDLGGTQVWNHTDVGYDALGRERSRLGAAFTDHRGVLVRPETVNEYDGLGLLRRSTQVGQAADEDRVTRYDYNANGDLVLVTAASGHQTRYQLDAYGRRVRVTELAVKNADGGTSDIVKEFGHDASGRVTSERDLGTGELRRTRFNAFGEVRERGLGSDGSWQEYFDYNVLGKIERSNAGDGVTKLYLYDRAGNTTRLIKSTGTDLKAVTLGAAAVDTALIHSFSAYDKRNLLVKTADIKIQYMEDQLKLASAFETQLAELYGAITIDKSSGGIQNAPTGVTGTGNGVYGVVNMTGASASTQMPPPPGLATMGRAWVETGSAGNHASREPGTNTTLRFSQALLGPNGGGIVYYRRPGIGDWTGMAFSGFTVNMPSGEGDWAYYVTPSGSGTYYRGTYTVTNGVAAFNAALGNLTPLTPSLDIPVSWAHKLLDQQVVTVEVRLNGYVVGGTLTGSGGSGVFSVPWWWMDGAALGVSHMNTRSLNYEYKVYVAPTTTTGRKNLVGYGSGTAQAGCDGTQNVASTITSNGSNTPYLPWVKLQGSNLTGWVELGVMNSPMGYAGLPPYDLRRYFNHATGETIISLQDWVPTSGYRDVPIKYQSVDAKFTGTLRVHSNGQASVVSLNSEPLGSRTVTITIPGAFSMPVLKLVQGTGDPRSGPNLAPWLKTGQRIHDFAWEHPAESSPTGEWRFFYETLDANGRINARGTGKYTVTSSGQITNVSLSPEAVADYLNLTPPAGTKTFNLQWRPVGGSGVWTTANVGPDLFFEDGRWRMRTEALMPTAGGASTLFYEFQYEAKDLGGSTLSKGGGSFAVQKTGQVSIATTYQERMPLGPITFNGSPGRTNATKMRLRYTPAAGGLTREVLLTGVWVGGPLTGSYQYKWAQPFDGRIIDSLEVYNFELTLLKDDGTEVLDEANKRIVTLGELKVGAPVSKGFEMKTTVVSVARDAQIKRFQTWNAFGEISEEYDERTLDRAQAMVAMYREAGLGNFSIDANAVRTKFQYNTLGQLIQKVDPQTFETLENGFRQRITPETSYGYDLLGRLTTSSDANGHTRKAYYDGAGTVNITRFAADGGVRKQKTDTFGDVRLMVDELNHRTAFNYDKLGHLVLMTRHDVTRFDNFHVADGLGRNAVGTSISTLYEVDALGRRYATHDALGNTQRTWYDSQDRVTKTLSAGGQTVRYSYVFVPATGGSETILGVGGVSTGGYRVSTTRADGLSSTDEKDYFGRTTWHSDLRQREFGYQYNLAGQLTEQKELTASLRAVGAATQHIKYEYLQNGLLYKIKDEAEGTVTSYGYDDAGNRVRESQSVTGQQGFQASSIAYDELNRVVRVWNGEAAGDYEIERSHDLRYEYDAVGNRRAAIAMYWDPTTRALRQTPDHFWYTYDAENRFTITKGSLVNHASSATDTSAYIVRNQGFELSYDLAGQRTSATDKDGNVEVYGYSGDGFLETVTINNVLRTKRRVDELGRTLDYIELDANSALRQRKISRFDGDGRIMEETVSGDTGADGTTKYYYYDNGQNNEPTIVQTGGGELARTEFTSAPDGHNQVTRYLYDYWDEAKQTQVRHAPGGFYEAVSSFDYDANGHLKHVTDEAAQRSIDYVTNADGMVLRRTESQNDISYQHDFFYAVGRRVGDVTDDPEKTFRVSYVEQLAQDLKGTPPDKFKNRTPVTSADWDQSYEPINSRYPSASATTYTVREGDSLQAIARAIWGDSAMWYLIAEANGLSDDGGLIAGQLLLIPNKVTNIHNNANTFRPYNPGEVIGKIGPQWNSATYWGGSGQSETDPWEDGGNRLEDYQWMEMWEQYHNTMDEYGAFSRKGSSSGGFWRGDPPPVSPNNILWGRFSSPNYQPSSGGYQSKRADLTSRSFDEFRNAQTRVGRPLDKMGSAYSAWDKDDTEVDRLLKRYPAPGPAETFAEANQEIRDQQQDQMQDRAGFHYNNGRLTIFRPEESIFERLDQQVLGSSSPRVSTPVPIGPYVPLVEGVYNFQSGNNGAGIWQAGWNTYPTNVALQTADGGNMLAPVVVTRNRTEAAEAAAQQSERIARAGAWRGARDELADTGLGFVNGAVNLWRDASDGGRRTEFSRNLQDMGVFKTGLYMGLNTFALGPWMAGGAAVNSTINLVTSQNSYQAGRNAVRFGLDAGPVVAGGFGVVRLGMAGRTSFATPGSMSVAADFAPMRPGPNAASTTLGRIESRFNGSRREVGFVVDSETGAILTVARQPHGQEASSFRFSQEQWAMAEGNWITHNHPSGFTLGPEDLAGAVSSGARGIRASTRAGVYELAFDGSFASDYRGHPAGAAGFVGAGINEVRQGMFADLRSGSLAVPQDLTGSARGAFLSNEMWIRYARQTPGLQYTFTPW